MLFLILQISGCFFLQISSYFCYRLRTVLLTAWHSRNINETFRTALSFRLGRARSAKSCVKMAENNCLAWFFCAKKAQKHQIIAFFCKKSLEISEKSSNFVPFLGSEPFEAFRKFAQSKGARA